MWQARWVRDALHKAHRDTPVQIQEVRTRAEAFPEQGLAEIGVGVFTRELDHALEDGTIDIAVHSLKDVPTDIPETIVIASVPERESPLDAFLSADGTYLDALPQKARLGTGSPRRRAQLLSLRPDLEIVALRGNVATRVRKMEEEKLHGIVLAHAGLRRLEEESRITHLIAPSVLVPAVGQGALGIAARRDDGEVRDLLKAVDHRPSHLRVLAERSYLRRLRGGCLVPAGALALWEEGEEERSAPEGLRLMGVIAAPDGSASVRGEVRGDADDAESLGIRLAEELLERGGAEILKELPRDSQ
jgi:hydroxymethylbilane synthase